LHALSYCYHCLQDGPAEVLDTVRSSLDKETLELEQLTEHMNKGARLVKEKERRLRQLQTRTERDVCISRLRRVLHGLRRMYIFVKGGVARIATYCIYVRDG
jgi:hypothetical protein